MRTGSEWIMSKKKAKMFSRPIAAASPDPDCSGGAGALRIRGGPDSETSYRLPPKYEPSNLQHSWREQDVAPRQ